MCPRAPGRSPHRSKSFAFSKMPRLPLTSRRSILYNRRLIGTQSRMRILMVAPEPFFEPSLIARSKTLREWRIAYSKKALRLGRELGASNVSITSGKALNGVPPEKAQKLLEEGLSRLLEEAERLKQRLSLEYEPALFIEKTEELKDLLGRMRSPYLGANLDLGHVDVMGEDPCHAIRVLKGSIFNIHLEDIRAHKHYHRIPGDGDLDFRAIFRQLDAVGYTGPLTWELYTYDEAPDEACQRTYKYLKAICHRQPLARGTARRSPAVSKFSATRGAPTSRRL